LESVSAIQVAEQRLTPSKFVTERALTITSKGEDWVDVTAMGCSGGFQKLARYQLGEAKGDADRDGNSEALLDAGLDSSGGEGSPRRLNGPCLRKAGMPQLYPFLDPPMKLARLPCHFVFTSTNPIPLELPLSTPCYLAPWILGRPQF